MRGLSRFSQRGLSMVELMVAMTLGLLLTAAVLQTFVGAKRSYEFQQEFARVQENGRFAMNFLTRAVRQADYWGCLKDSSQVISILNTVASESVTSGFDATNAGSSYAHSSGMPNNNNTTPDLFIVRGGSRGGIPVVATPSANSASIQLDKLDHPDGVNIGAGDVLLVTDCIKGALFEVTNTTVATQTVVHNAGSGNPGNSTQGLGAVYGPPDAHVYAADAQKYWIRTSALSGEPVLVRGREYDALSGGAELVEGIENLQLLLGYDNDGDGVAETYAPPPPLVSGNQDEVVAVQINIVARSLRDNVTDSSDNFTFAGINYTPNDRRLRKVFTTNVAIRNRLD